jgi:hypothetical protein
VAPPQELAGPEAAAAQIAGGEKKLTQEIVGILLRIQPVACRDEVTQLITCFFDARNAVGQQPLWHPP